MPSRFKELHVERFHDPTQAVFALDHNVQDTSGRRPAHCPICSFCHFSHPQDANLGKYKAIQAFAAQHAVDFYPAGRGIGHQVMCEEGYIRPFTMVVASDSHSNMWEISLCSGTQNSSSPSLLFHQVRRPGLPGHADCADGRSQHLGHGQDLVAGAAHCAR